ncbi:hypothetical protein ACGFIJ_14050 [Microbispora bryophytorum]|uniref:hypothetical protein n=1 Tax=Microbispora bryophytorum TaxID=1460882 RepID=UPI0037107FD2
MHQKFNSGVSVLLRGGAAGVLAFAMLFGLSGTGPASLTGTAVATAPTVIPQGFLLTEAEARAPQSDESLYEEGWAVSDGIGQPLQVSPCDKVDFGIGWERTSMRTITHFNSAPGFSSEQLVLHRTVGAAQRALKLLRADLRQCSGSKYSVKALRAGDEAIWVQGPQWGGRGDTVSIYAAIVRRGKAVMIYALDEGNYQPGLGLLTKPAKKMAAKVCGIRGICD